MSNVNVNSVTVEAAAYASYTSAHNAAMRGEGSKEAARALRAVWVEAVWAIHAESDRLRALVEKANPTGKVGQAYRLPDEGRYVRLRAAAIAFDEAAASALEVSPNDTDPDLE